MRWHLMVVLFFFFNDTATTEIYTLSLHDALPISPRSPLMEIDLPSPTALIIGASRGLGLAIAEEYLRRGWHVTGTVRRTARSEEHTSELQSHLNLVCRLLLAKKNISTAKPTSPRH